MIEVVRKMDVFKPGQERYLAKKDDRFYVVSYIPAAFDTGKPETLVFAADSDGEEQNFTSVAGGIGRSPYEAMADLETRGENDDTFDEYVEEMGGPVGAMLGSLSTIANQL